MVKDGGGRKQDNWAPHTDHIVENGLEQNGGRNDNWKMSSFIKMSDHSYGDVHKLPMFTNRILTGLIRKHTFQLVLKENDK